NNNLIEIAMQLYKNWFLDFIPFSTNSNIPNGWKLGKISDIVNILDSKRKPISGNVRDKMKKIYPYYGAASLMDYVDDYLFDGVYLLLGEDGTVMDSNGFPILQYVEGKFWVNNHAHILEGKNGFSVEMLFLLFSLTNIKSIVTGAVQPKISQSNLKNIDIFIPPKDVLYEFDTIIQPVFSKIRSLRNANKILSNIRDSLITNLLSGKIDVSNIDI
ncbi:restriction endonuclease subunit S, partial [Fusobacterium sp.]|uniref:restriction endonuclease subunit S n=1 Tax=Fusobacterium sp. TaxID=68766 RepID=UPI002607D3BE